MVKGSEFLWTGSINTVSGVSRLGGPPVLTDVIDPKGENNIFNIAPTAEVVAGSTKYRLLYVYYTGTDTPVENCSLSKFTDTKDARTRVDIAFDPQMSKYVSAPWQDFNGTSTRVDQADDPTLDLSVWTLVAWFRTGASYSAEGMIINKGGIGSDTAGENMNYGVFINTSNQLQGKFETGAGVDNDVTSPLTYNDNKWHCVVFTYDGSNMKLYVDGVQTPVATTATSATAEQNAKPLTLGANSRDSSRFFNGSLDECKVFNRAWTAQEVDDYYNLNTFDDTGLVYENKFGTDNGSRIGQYLTNETTVPAGSPVWMSVENAPTLPANIGTFRTGMFYPFLIRYKITATSPAISIDNDLSAFRIYFGIKDTQTGGGGGEEGGGQGGGAEGDLNIFFNGDGCENSSTAIGQIDQCVSGKADLVISAGDNAYGKNASKFFDCIKRVDDKASPPSSIGAKTRICMGNHEYEDGSGGKVKEEKNHFGLPNTYYSIEVGNVHVLFLDSESSPTGSTQTNFADSDLNQASKDVKIDWIIVVFHRPLYTASGKHGPDESNMRTTYHPMFDKYGVDLVIQGHQHSYQVSYPCTNNKSNSPKVVTKTAGPYDFKALGHGTIFIVNGTWGHDTGGSLYKLGAKPSWSRFQNDDTNAVGRLKTTNSGKTLTMDWLDESGQSQDSFVINK